MVNYGYNASCVGWNEAKKEELAERIEQLMKKKGYCTDFFDPKREGFTPFLEVDGVYRGVRIRAITHLPEKAQNELIKEADKIYEEVMGLKKGGK
jgi:hypothetical protein